MKLVFSLASVLAAMLYAVLPASSAVPDHLYIMGHIAGTTYWEVSPACPEGIKTEDGKMFVFENIRIPNGWGAGVGTFAFIKDNHNPDKNGSDNYFGYLSPNGDDLDLRVGDVYKPLTHKAVKGYRVPEGTYTFTVDFTNENKPTVSVCRPEDLPAGGPPPEPAPTGTLPVLYINVYQGAAGDEKTDFNNEIISAELNHKNYFSNAEYWLDMNGVDWMGKDAKNLGSEEEPLPLEIKARGNWTRRGFVKKPFKLKLGSKASMLGLTKSKHFAILAHADDNMGYLRNYVGFNLGKRIGLPWTPQQQPVEVVINGDYRGVYFLTESIRIDEQRVNIREGEDEDNEIALATGGYIVELDNYSDEAAWGRTDGDAVWHDPHRFPIYVTPDTPEIYSDTQKNFVSSQFNTMHNLVGAHNQDLWKYLDMDDAVRYYLVEEILGHYEAYHGSTYLFRDMGADKKWHFSPLWDCGHAFEGGTGNFFYNSDKSMGNTWVRCLKETRGFDDKLKATWKWFMSSEYKGLMEDIDTYCGLIAEAAKMDHKRWKDAGVPEYTDGWEAWPVQDNSDMDSRKQTVTDYLEAKINWLQGQWGEIPTAPQAEPARDTTSAAELDDLYKNNLPTEWNEFEPAVAGDHHVSVEDHILLGTISNEATRGNLNLKKTVINHDTSYLAEGEAASVVLDDETGNVHLIAPVPGVYDVTLVMKEHRADENTYYQATEYQQTVTVRPTFGGFNMTDAEISINENGQFEIDYVPNNPWAVKFWSPYGNQGSTTGFDELYYTVLYPAQTEPQKDVRKAPAARAEEGGIPHGLANRYDDEKGVDISGANGLKMAMKISGALSDPQEFSFISQGGVVTVVETVEEQPEGDVRYFDINGVEISEPTAPGIYIRISDGKVTKKMIR